jgi:hypothetical protein
LKDLDFIGSFRRFGSMGGWGLVCIVPVLIGPALLLLALEDQPVIADHLANGLLGSRLNLLLQPAHVLAPSLLPSTRELADVSDWNLGRRRWFCV